MLALPVAESESVARPWWSNRTASRSSIVFGQKEILNSIDFLNQNYIQSDHSAWGEPPVDFKTKVPFWPGLPWPSQAKVEVLL